MKKLFSLLSLFVATMLIATSVQAKDKRFNVKIEGKGRPVVIFDSGYGDGIYTSIIPDTKTETWGKVQPLIAQETKTFAYDRIGLGDSAEDASKGRTAMDRAHQIHDALKENNIHGPYIYVAHSIAGFTARAFAAEYPNEVYGVVFIDCTSVGESQKAIDYFKVNAPEFVELFMSQFTSADGTWEDVLASEKQIETLDGLRNKRLTIITSTAPMGFPELEESHQTFQKAQLNLSNYSKQIFSTSDHYIMLSPDSELVTNAIKEMIDEFNKDAHWKSHCKKK